MKVQDLMTSHPVYCESDSDLALAAGLMWIHDCGALPVVKFGQPVGIITDRDIAIALGTRNLRASETTVGDVAARHVVTCAPGDTVSSAMAAMRAAKVRRLAVTDSSGHLAGMLTLNDLALAAIDVNEFVSTMQAICEHRSAEMKEMKSLEIVVA